MNQLLFSFEGLVFRIVADSLQMRWQIVDLVGHEPAAIETAIRTSFPQSTIQPSREDMVPPSTLPLYRYVLKYRQAIPEFTAPILQVDDIKAFDPLAHVTQAMSQLQAGEQIIYTFVVVGLADYAYKAGEQQLTRKVYDGSLLGLLFPVREDRYVPELQRVMHDKLQQRLYQCALFIQVDTPDPERFEALCIVDSQMVHFDRPHFNGLRPVPENFQHQRVFVQTDEADLQTSALGLLLAYIQGQEAPAAIRALRQETRLILEPREIAALWHLPHSGHTASTIRWSTSTQVDAPQALKGSIGGLQLGLNRFGGRETPIYLLPEDRATHCLIVGKTGVGKSNLLHRLIHQDIQNGRGVAVIDPHGQLIHDLLQTSIPREREHEVVILDLAQPDYPIPLNPLRGLQGEVAVGRMVNIFHHLYDDLGDMPQTADALENALFTLQGDPAATLRDVTRLFADDGYRQRLLTVLDDEVVEEYWRQDYESLSILQQKQISLPVTRRMRSFYRNKDVRAILCHPDSIDFGQLIRERKILLVSLNASHERIPDREQQLIGSLIIARLQLAVMSGVARQAPFYLYVDEVQRFVTGAIEQVFSEARKFNLSLTVANQYLKQLTKGTLEAVLGNTGAMVAFQTGDDDAGELVPYLKPQFTRDDLTHLNKYEAAVWMRYQGQQQPAFSLAPLTPLPKPANGRQVEARLRALSIQRYTPKTRDVVFAGLQTRYAQSPAGGVEEREAEFYEPL